MTLPGHRPKVEKAIDGTAEQIFDLLPVYKIDTNPDSCEMEILEILAVSYNVDISGLEPAQARRLVKKAFLLNKYKGTVYAVKEALTAMFPASTLVEHEDEPFMFSIRIEFGEDDIYDTDAHKALIKVLDASKNARSELKSVDLSLPDAGMAAVAQSACLMEIKGNTEIGYSHKNSFIKVSNAVFKI